MNIEIDNKIMNVASRTVSIQKSNKLVKYSGIRNPFSYARSKGIKIICINKN